MNKPELLPPAPSDLDDEMDLLDLLLVATESLRLLVLGPMLAACVAFGYLTYTAEPSYTARTTLLPPSGGSASAGASALLSQFGGLAGLAGIAIPSGGGQASKPMGYLESDLLRRRLISRFALVQHYRVRSETAAREYLKDSTAIVTDKKTNLLFVEVTDRDPKMASALANAFVEELQAIFREQAIADSKARLETLEKMIAEVTSRPYKNPEIGRSMLQGLLGQYESARLDSVGAGQGSRIEQIDAATPPALPNPLNRLKVAITTALTTLVLLLFFVFTRHALRKADADEMGAGKMAQIRASLRRAFFLKG